MLHAIGKKDDAYFSISMRAVLFVLWEMSLGYHCVKFAETASLCVRDRISMVGTGGLAVASGANI